MIKLNRTSEYGLIALKHMDQKKRSGLREVTSAREVAEKFQLPFEITAKVLQRLKDAGFIQSAQGARGGYGLKVDLHQITLLRFLEGVEGPQAVVTCLESEQSCGYRCQCQIQSFMNRINDRVQALLSTVYLSEMAVSEPALLNLALSSSEEISHATSHL